MTDDGFIRFVLMERNDGDGLSNVRQTSMQFWRVEA